MLNLAIGLTIRKLREEKGVTARTLGELADFRDYELSRIERGNQRLDLAGAMRIAKALGVSLDDLCSRALRIEPHVGEHKKALESAAKARQKLRELSNSLMVE